MVATTGMPTFLVVHHLFSRAPPCPRGQALYQRLSLPSVNRNHRTRDRTGHGAWQRRMLTAARGPSPTVHARLRSRPPLQDPARGRPRAPRQLPRVITADRLVGGASPRQRGSLV